MKCVILCGGKGSRLVEMTDVIPKPMLPVGGKPLLQHIIDFYRHYGVDDFVLPLGYKKEHIIAHLLGNTPQISSSSSISGNNQQFIFKEDYRVTVVHTGDDTMTGGRLKRVAHLLNEPFHFTYGDGLSNVNLNKVEITHLGFDNVATLTLVHPEGRFGRATVQDDGLITEFGEKIDTTDWINGGFSILTPEIFKYIDDDDCNLEKEVYPILAMQKDLVGYKHEGFWKCVDTRRDLLELEEIYQQGGAKWLMFS